MAVPSTPAPAQFESREAFVAALREGLLGATTQGCQEICCLDASFAVWPWSDAELLDALTQWVRPQRRLRLLAMQYEDLRRLHPRFVRWRQTWGHVVQARQFGADALPTLVGGAGLAATLLARGLLCVRLLDDASWRGVVSYQRLDEHRTQEWFDAIAQRSSESFASSTLGL